MTGKTVGIIIPFFGNFDIRRLQLATESILSQEGVNVELVVAGTDRAMRVSNISDLEKFGKKGLHEAVSTGNVINQGIRMINGEYAYISDADIIFKNSRYLEALVNISTSTGSIALKRPPMRRLTLDDFEAFYHLARIGGVGSALNSLDYSQDYVAKIGATNKPIRVFRKFENGRMKVFIASEKDFQEYIGSDENRGAEPKFFNQDRHCGATFVPTEALRAVGGYCEEFVSWGVWDADAQWKLESTIGMKIIPYDKDFEVIHLDHEKGYFSKSRWEHDKELQNKRRPAGAEDCIQRDRLVYFGGGHD